MRIIVTGGHHIYRTGAEHEGFSEFPETRAWADLIAQGIKEHAKPSDDLTVTVLASGRLSNKIRTVGIMAKPDDLLIEIHFNSHPNPERKANGFETLICPNSTKGLELAKVVHNAMARVIDKPDRGIHDGYMQRDPSKPILGLLLKTPMPAIIIEPEFIQNSECIVSMREKVCEAIALDLVSHYGKSKGAKQNGKKTKKPRKKTRKSSVVANQKKN